ncbi:mucin-5AC-like [Sycon ciliatum]|uniref:mucin-5AC-like n=1 Tax=Sycon ciliatum TaxID=27933 RepID=UPI0031F6959C
MDFTTAPGSQNPQEPGTTTATGQTHVPGVDFTTAPGSQNPQEPGTTTATGQTHVPGVDFTTAPGSQNPQEPGTTTATGQTHVPGVDFTTAPGSQNPQEPGTTTATGQTHVPGVDFTTAPVPPHPQDPRVPGKALPGQGTVQATMISGVLPDWSNSSVTANTSTVTNTTTTEKGATKTTATPLPLILNSVGSVSLSGMTLWVGLGSGAVLVIMIIFGILIYMRSKRPAKSTMAAGDHATVNHIETCASQGYERLGSQSPRQTQPDKGATEPHYVKDDQYVRLEGDTTAESGNSQRQQGNTIVQYAQPNLSSQQPPDVPATPSRHERRSTARKLTRHSSRLSDNFTDKKRANTSAALTTFSMSPCASNGYVLEDSVSTCTALVGSEHSMDSLPVAYAILQPESECTPADATAVTSHVMNGGIPPGHMDMHHSTADTCGNRDNEEIIYAKADQSNLTRSVSVTDSAPSDVLAAMDADRGGYERPMDSGIASVIAIMNENCYTVGSFLDDLSTNTPSPGTASSTTGNEYNAFCGESPLKKRGLSKMATCIRRPTSLLPTPGNLNTDSSYSEINMDNMQPRMPSASRLVPGTRHRISTLGSDGNKLAVLNRPGSENRYQCLEPMH